MTEFKELKIDYGAGSCNQRHIKISPPKVGLIPIGVSNDAILNTFNLNLDEACQFSQKLQEAIALVREENYKRDKHNLAVERREEKHCAKHNTTYYVNCTLCATANLFAKANARKKKNHQIEGDLSFL